MPPGSQFERVPDTSPSRGGKRPYGATSIEGLPLVFADADTPFDVSHEDHPLSLKYGPEFLARGGEHLVYDIPDHPDVVVKVNLPSIIDSTRLAQQMDVEPTSDDPKYLEALNKQLVRKRELQKALRRHFGRDHVAQVKYALVDIPLPIDIDHALNPLISFTKEYDLPVVTRTKAIVAVQPRLKDLKRPDRISVSASNVEFANIKGLRADSKYKTSYSRVTDPLMDAETARETEITSDALTDVINHPNFNELIDAAEHDTDLRSVLKDFCERCIAFAEDTGEILDFGKDNIIFLKNNGTWTYLIADGIYGLQDHVIETARKGFSEAREGKENRDIWTNNAMLQAVGFTRAVNSMAKVSGSNRFFTLIPSRGGPPANVLTILLSK